MVIALKNVDVYSTEQLNVDTDRLMTDFKDMLSDVFALQRQTTSCEALAALADAQYSKESFGQKVKDTLKKLWAKIVELAKMIWAKLEDHYRKQGDDYYRSGKAKEDVKNNPVPKATPDLKEQLKKLAKAIDDAYSKSEDTSIDVKIELPFSDSKNVVVLKQLQRTVSAYYDRYVLKLEALFKGMNFYKFVEAISNAHYSTRDDITKALMVYKSAGTKDVSVELDQILTKLDTNPEMTKLVDSFSAALGLENDATVSVIERFKNVVMATGVKMSEVAPATSSVDLIDELFDTSKRDTYAKIDQQVAALGWIAKDKIGSDVSFLNDAMQSAAKVDVSHLENDKQALMYDFMNTLVFLLKATEGFIKIIVNASTSEQRYIKQFLTLQKTLTEAQE